MTQKEKAARPGRVNTASKLLSKLHSISVSAWALSYTLEEVQQIYELQDRHFRRLACCAGLSMEVSASKLLKNARFRRLTCRAGLALLQLVGGRHV